MIRRRWGDRHTDAHSSRRGHWLKAGAMSVALAAVVSGVTPVHATLEAQYVVQGSPCHPLAGQPTECHAGMELHLLLPNDYAVCTALAVDPDAGPTECGGTTITQDAVAFVDVGWYLGSCAQREYGGGNYWHSSLVWGDSPPGQNVSAAQTCSTIDSAYQQTFNVANCPGTSFTVTVDMKGNNDGTFLGSYNVVASGTCAGLFNVFVAESPGYV